MSITAKSGRKHGMPARASVAFAKSFANAKSPVDSRMSLKQRRASSSSSTTTTRIKLSAVSLDAINPSCLWPCPDLVDSVEVTCEEYLKDNSILIGCNASQPSVHEMPDCFHAPKTFQLTPPDGRAKKESNHFYIFLNIRSRTFLNNIHLKRCNTNVTDPPFRRRNLVAGKECRAGWRGALCRPVARGKLGQASLPAC